MLASSVGGIPIDCCIYNASGPRTGSIEALQKIGKSKSGAVLSKSATLVAQDGNPLPRFINKIKLGNYCDGSINSEGLPNLGIDYYISDEALESMKQFSKPYIVSLSGLSLEDNVIMIKKALEKPSVAGIELNLACPNIPGKPVIAYDFEQLESVLATVTAIPNLKSKPFGVKLAPYFDMLHFDRAISILSKYPIQFVVTTNTIGNCLFVDADNECASIAPKGGLGGLGGGYIKPVALANVRMISQKLIEYNRTDIDVIGVGGVSTGRDAFELILCGAKAVQVGTCHWTEGPVCFERISEELIDIMRTKGYTSIEDFRGKLKAYTKSSSASKSVANADKDDESGMKNGSGSVFMISEIIYQSLIVLLFAALLYARSRSK